jgi:hypothetical protein
MLGVILWLLAIPAWIMCRTENIHTLWKKFYKILIGIKPYLIVICISLSRPCSYQGQVMGVLWLTKWSYDWLQSETLLEILFSVRIVSRLNMGNELEFSVSREYESYRSVPRQRTGAHGISKRSARYRHKLPSNWYWNTKQVAMIWELCR